MAKVVYNIPMIPTKENGANEFRFLSRQSGKSTNPVTPANDCVLVTAIPAAAKSDVKVSAKIMEYDKFPAKQSMKHEKAIMGAQRCPTVASQASA